MDHDINRERAKAQRPLRETEALVASLRGGSLASDGIAETASRVVEAIEMSLRLLLRDSTSTDIEVRLRALAPDEIGTDEVLNELRHEDVISIELAAAIHDLLRARGRAARDEGFPAGYAALAAQVHDRLGDEIAERESAPARVAEPPVDGSASHPSERAVEVPGVHAVPAEPPMNQGVSRGVWAAVAVLAVVVIAALVWRLAPGDDSEMAEGIALFRSGSYQDAASHFWRYAESHPDEVTPHLYLARIHRRLDRFDLAGPELQKALNLAPNDPDVQTELAFLLLDTKRYDVAARRFHSAIALDSSTNQAWAGLVLAFRAAGEPDSAAMTLAQAPAEVRALIGQQSSRDSTF